MISQGMVDEIRRLLANQNLSQRRIARMTGISRATVGAIASGSRPDYPIRSTTDNELFVAPCGPAARCPGCGGRVYLPCRLCHVRRLKRIEVDRRRRRRWLADYLSSTAIPPALVRAAEAHLQASPTVEPEDRAGETDDA